MAKRTEEYLAMIKATVRLTNAVKNELTPLSQELVARELISVDQGVELRNGNVGAVDRAANLVALVTNKVGQDRKNFYCFVEVLTDNQSVYKEILEDLQPIYKTGNHVYNKGARAILTIRQPWYHKRLSREDAESKLGDGGTDSFLVRESAQEVGKLVLSIRSGDNFFHFPIKRGVGSYQVEGTEEPFPSLIELIDHYVQHGLPESDSGELVTFKSPCICDASLVSKSNNGEASTSSLHKPGSSSSEYTYVDVTINESQIMAMGMTREEIAHRTKEKVITKSESMYNTLYITLGEESGMDQPDEIAPDIVPSDLPRSRRPPVPTPRWSSGKKVLPPPSPPPIPLLTGEKPKPHKPGHGEERPIINQKPTPPPKPQPPPNMLRRPLSEGTTKALMPYWYRPHFSREEGISFIRSLDPGSFIVRDSVTIPGGYTLVMKISQENARQWRKMTEAAQVTEDMLITHFLIQPDPEGVKLQGWNERPFKSLPEFIAHHTVEKLCLPCKLVLPKSSAGSGGVPQVRRKPAGMKQALQTGAVYGCELVYLGSVEVSGPGSESVVRETVEQLKTLGLSTMNIVTFKASMSGITLTDNINGMYIKRQYPMSSITYCGLDPNDTRWDFPSVQHQGETISLSNKQCFGLVLRPPDSKGNTCLVFAEFDSSQPVIAVVNYIQRAMRSR